MPTGIVLDTTFDNADLPAAATFGSRIRALDSLVAWFQADRNSVAMEGGKIASFSDIAGGALTLAQATASRRATLTDSAIGGYAAANFSEDLSAKYATPGNYDATPAHSYAVILKPQAQDASGTVVGIYTSDTDRDVVLALTGGSFQYVRNTTGLGMPFVAGEAGLLICAWDGTQMNGEYNGVAGTPKTPTGTVTPKPLFIGASSHTSPDIFNGQIADLMVFSEDILANPTAAQLVRDYARYVYGIGA